MSLRGEVRGDRPSKCMKLLLTCVSFFPVGGEPRRSCAAGVGLREHGGVPLHSAYSDICPAAGACGARQCVSLVHRTSGVPAKRVKVNWRMLRCVSTLVVFLHLPRYAKQRRRWHQPAPRPPFNTSSQLQEGSPHSNCRTTHTWTKRSTLLREGRRRPTPPALASLCCACSPLKVTNTRLFESVLKHVSQYWYDYPASSLAEIGCAVAPSVPEPMKCDFVPMFGFISGGECFSVRKSVVCCSVHFESTQCPASRTSTGTPHR